MDTEVNDIKYIQEYKLTVYSLYAAESVGLETKDIIEYLKRLKAVERPQNTKTRVTRGSADEVVRSSQARVAAVTSGSKAITTGPSNDAVITGTGSDAPPLVSTADIPEDISNFNAKIDKDDEYLSKEIISFEIDQNHLEPLQKSCIALEYPLLAEYDFIKDTQNPDIPIDLKPNAILRPYQERALGKMFGNGRARSGLIVLPCGAGKSLVGVTAESTVRKKALVLCNSSVSVEQWKAQFKMWSTATDNIICRFTSDLKEKPMNASILITTYPMIMYGQKRTHEVEQTMKLNDSKSFKCLKNNPAVNTIFVCKIADTSFDLPDANVLIEISTHSGSRRQEAQRLGRILRAKKGAIAEDYYAIFYTLVSRDTTEMGYSRRRQRFLVNQGYSYKVVTHLSGMEEGDLHFETKEEQIHLLQQVLTASDREGQEETPLVVLMMLFILK
ncbi:hypothetical protein QYM36_016069 [Artemia franciscana]|uniref:DNA 3'-5' helicase n=1 Tax=Artemia franciscana TaxID=6661 RepID=A0AA88H6A1_ARTSF|nr:hypothetical protein QYM36_016069 [Artemia franciscana]